MWELAHKKTIPLYQEIVELIMNHIQEGRLLPGEKLPSERKLADLFQVNRSTVVHGLDELVAMGVIIRKQGSGTIVNEGKWGVFAEPTTNWRHYLSQGALTSSQPYQIKIHEALKQNQWGDFVDLYTGELPLELIPGIDLPNISWKEFLKEEAYQDDLGYVPLRETVIKSIQEDYDLELPIEQLLITSGAQQALFLIVQFLLQAGDAVAIEEPSFFYPLSLFQGAGIRLYGIPVDHEGMRVDLLEQKIVQHKIKMVLVNPTFQNPTGTSMSLRRRQELVELCRRKQVPIVEDDVFGQLQFEATKSLPPLKKLDPENVLYIGSLSKILGSTTKIGWLSAPVAVLEKLAEARKELDLNLSIFPQVLADNALKHPLFPEKIRTLKKELAQRSQTFIEALTKYAPAVFDYHVPEGGYYIWLRFSHLTLKKNDYDRLIKEKILVAPSFLFGLSEPALRINFARLSEDEAPEVAKKLADIVLEWKNKAE